MFIRFGATHERDRQTDGRTDRHRVPAITALMHSIARQKRLDKFWADQNVMFDWTADITGTGVRSEYIVESDQKV